MKKKGKEPSPLARAFLRTILVMKFIVLLLLITTTQLAANTTYGQQVTIRMHNASFKQITKEIEKQTILTFLYYDSGISKLQKMDVNVVNTDYSEVLNKFLDGSNLSYRNVDNTIVIIPKIAVKETSIEDLLIKGHVTDSLGKPLSGVTVHIKGTNIRVMTKPDGSFALTSSSKEVTLVFSFLGMKTQEVSVNRNISNLNIVLKETAIAIKEVIVTGYNNIRKESFTGTYTQIKKEDLLKVTSNSLIDALQVFDPSLRVMGKKELGSDPNVLPEFYIRGRSGFPGVKELDKIEGSNTVSQFSLKNNPNLPIFIMDGFEVSLEKVFDLDLNRINQITILKDAAATAMYGSRASNGVIVIETIAPKAGEFRFSYSGNLGLTLPDLSSYNMMNAQEKLEAEVAAGVFLPHPDTPPEDYQSTLINGKWMYLLKRNEILKGVDTYWLSQPLSTMFSQKHNLYLEGGTEAIRLGIDFRYDNQNGVMKGSSRNRMGTGLTVEYRHKGIQIRNQTFFDFTGSKDSPYGKFSNYSRMQPYYSIRNENDGSYIREQPNYTDKIDKNPLYEATLGNFNRNKYKEWTNNFSANWHIKNLFYIKGQFAIDYKEANSEAFLDPASTTYERSNPFKKGELSLSETGSFDWNANLFGSYNVFKDGHNINLSAGFNAKSMDYNYVSSQYRGFSNSNYNSPAYAYEIVKKPELSDNKTRLFGSFAALNYTLNDIYLFDASFRLDGSSEFGAERKWAPFWSLGTGVNFHNTSFLKNSSIINLLRLKVNVGQTGKSNFSPYMARNTYKIMLDDWYPTGIGGNIIYRGNNKLTWEKQVSWNIGADLSFLKSYNLEFNYYHKKTFDLITDVTLPSSSGFTVYRDNIGKVLNEGFEFMGNFNLVNTRNISLVLFGNIAHNKNKIVQIAESLKSYNDRINKYYEKYYNISGSSAYLFVNQDNERNLKYIKPIMKYEEGNSLTTIYGMKSLGINPANGQEIFLKRDGTITSEWSAVEQQPIGNAEPWAQGSFGLNARFKRFTFYTTFMYEWGGDQYNETLVNNVENVNLSYYNADKRVLTQRWQKPGDLAPLKDIADRYYVTRPTSRFIQRENSIVLNSLSLGYDFNPAIIRKYKFNTLRLMVNMNNIARFSTIQQEMGLDYPFARTLNFTVNATF